MELVATAAWYGDGRTESVAEVRSRCPARLERAFSEITAVKGGFHRLIAAFYFQATERSGTSDPAFEFTHKTFGEYLTARSIIRAIGEMHDGLQLERNFYIERNATESWFKLCGRQPMDSNLGRFLVDEFAMPQWQERLPGWRATLLRVMQFVLDEGVPLPALEGLSFRKAQAQARNAEEALLTALAACSKLTRSVASIRWPDIHALGSLIHRIRAQREYARKGMSQCHVW